MFIELCSLDDVVSLVVDSLVVVIVLLEEDSLSIDVDESLLLEEVSWLEVELLEVVWLLHPTINILDKTNNFLNNVFFLKIYHMLVLFLNTLIRLNYCLI